MQQRSQHRGCKGGDRQSDQNADAGEAETAAQHQAEHLTTGRANREPNPEFLPSLIHDKRQHAINPDAREQQGQAGEQDQYRPRQPRRRDGGIHDVFERAQRGHWHLRIKTAHVCTHRGCQGHGIALRPHHQCQVARRTPGRLVELAERAIKLRLHLGGHPVVCDVAHNADDRDPRRRLIAAHPEATADRAAAIPVLARHRFVNQRHILAADGVGGCEVPTLDQCLAHGRQRPV